MRTAGVIAEYNPFHNGHRYHLEQARLRSGADFTVAVMSPDFVQRGEPAIFDKYARAKMALENGADLVLELPVCYACGSAEYFAEGAVALLAGLGVVDTLCCGVEPMAGSETGPQAFETEYGREAAGARMFHLAAQILLEEPAPFRQTLHAMLRQGAGFPAAREQAVLACLASLSEAGKGMSVPSGFLAKPNSILAAEYAKAIRKQKAALELLPVARVGSGYHEAALTPPFASASSIRRVLCGCGEEIPDEVRGCIPENVRDDFCAACRKAVVLDDLSPYLAMRLLETEHFEEVLDMGPELSARIRALRFRCLGRPFADVVQILAAKHLTNARVRRALLHLILGITADQVERFRSRGTVFYARVLGFRREAAPLLHEIKKKGTIPLLSKNAAAPGQLGEDGRRMFCLDVSASHLYRSIVSLKYGTHLRSEYEMSPVIAAGPINS